MSTQPMWICFFCFSPLFPRFLLDLWPWILIHRSAAFGSSAYVVLEYVAMAVVKVVRTDRLA